MSWLLKTPKGSGCSLSIILQMHCWLFNRLLKMLRYKWLIFKWGKCQSYWKLKCSGLVHTHKNLLSPERQYEMPWAIKQWSTGDWKWSTLLSCSWFGEASIITTSPQSDCAVYIYRISLLCAYCEEFFSSSLFKVRVCVQQRKHSKAKRHFTASPHLALYDKRR